MQGASHGHFARSFCTDVLLAGGRAEKSSDGRCSRRVRDVDVAVLDVGRHERTGGSGSVAASGAACVPLQRGARPARRASYRCLRSCVLVGGKVSARREARGVHARAWGGRQPWREGHWARLCVQRAGGGRQAPGLRQAGARGEEPGRRRQKSARRGFLSGILLYTLGRTAYIDSRCRHGHVTAMRPSEIAHVR